MSTLSNATIALEREHRSAKAVADTMLVIADRVEEGRRIDTSLLAELIFFLRLFGDQCQTAEEDELLFPALEAKRTPAAPSLIADLRNDHRHAMSLTSELLQAADEHAAGHESARKHLAGILRRLSRLYQEHTWKEDRILLPLAETFLPAKDLDDLSRAFERIESGINSEEVANRIARRAARCTCHAGKVLV